MIRLFDTELYFNKIQEFDHIPYVQSRAWYNYLTQRGESIALYLDSETDTQVAFYGREKILPVLRKKVLLIDTPLLKRGLSEKTIRKRFLPLVDLNYAGIEIDSISEYNVEFEVGIRRVGFLRPLRFSRCPLTIIIRLNNPFNFDTKWKRNVRSAIEAGIRVDEVKVAKFEDAVLFTSLFKETRKMKSLKYDFSAESIYELLKEASIRLFYAYEKELVVSAQIIYSHNNICYSIMRANGSKSRLNNAAYLLYNNILETLAREGNLSFDLGRIPPSNNETDQVYHFKNLTRGEKFQYNGEWVFYKNKRIEDMMFFYKHYALRLNRY